MAKKPKTLAQLVRARCGKTIAACAEELAILTGTTANPSRWGRLERHDPRTLDHREALTVFYMSRILHCEMWEIMPEAHRQMILDRGAKKAKR